METRCGLRYLQSPYADLPLQPQMPTSRYEDFVVDLLTRCDLSVWQPVYSGRMLSFGQDLPAAAVREPSSVSGPLSSPEVTYHCYSKVKDIVAALGEST